MGEHPNAALYRDAMEKMENEDFEAWADYLADDVVWHQIGAETIQGKAALMESMGQYEGMDWDVDVHDVVANDEHLVALVTATVTAGGESFTYRTAEIAHVEDGKITERWAFSDDTAAINEFFAKLAAG